MTTTTATRACGMSRKVGAEADDGALLDRDGVYRQNVQSSQMPFKRADILLEIRLHTRASSAAPKASISRLKTSVYRKSANRPPESEVRSNMSTNEEKKKKWQNTACPAIEAQIDFLHMHIPLQIQIPTAEVIKNKYPPGCNPLGGGGIAESVVHASSFPSSYSSCRFVKTGWSSKHSSHVHLHARACPVRSSRAKVQRRGEGFSSCWEVVSAVVFLASSEAGSSGVRVSGRRCRRASKS